MLVELLHNMIEFVWNMKWINKIDLCHIFKFVYLLFNFKIKEISYIIVLWEVNFIILMIDII